MTYPVISKWTQLREGAWRYYEAVVYPCHPDQFDATNPAPREALNIELGRINERERKEGRSW